jgi:hypothetical protein
MRYSLDRPFYLQGVTMNFTGKTALVTIEAEGGSARFVAAEGGRTAV